MPLRGPLLLRSPLLKPASSVDELTFSGKAPPSSLAFTFGSTMVHLSPHLVNKSAGLIQHTTPSLVHSLLFSLPLHPPLHPLLPDLHQSQPSDPPPPPSLALHLHQSQAPDPPPPEPPPLEPPSLHRVSSDVALISGDSVLEPHFSNRNLEKSMVVFSSSVLVLEIEIVWSWFMVTDVTKLPRFEDFIGLSCVECVELPCFEVFDNSLASSCIPCVALLICRNVTDFPLQKMWQVYVDNAWLATALGCGLCWWFTKSHRPTIFMVSATRSLISSVPIAEHLTIKSALLEAHSLELQHINVFHVSLSLAAFSRLKDASNEPESLCQDLLCLHEVFSLLSYYVYALEDFNFAFMAMSLMCNFKLSSIFGA